MNVYDASKEVVLINQDKLLDEIAIELQRRRSGITRSFCSVNGLNEENVARQVVDSLNENCWCEWVKDYPTCL